MIALDPNAADILQDAFDGGIDGRKRGPAGQPGGQPFKYAWPEQIRNILAVPVGPADKMMGLLVATNILNKPDFDSTDVKLFNSRSQSVCRLY